MNSEITVEEIYEIAQSVSKKVLNKLGVYDGFLQAEDVVGEYIVKFIEKDYIKRFDLRKGTLVNYIYQGLKNTAISMLRKMKHDFGIFSNDTNEVIGKETVVYGDRFGRHGKEKSLRGHNEVEKDIQIGDLSQKIGVWRFGKSKEVKINDSVYTSTSDSVLRLLLLGFSRADLAKVFSVSEPTISKLLVKMRESGLTRSDITE